MTDTPKTLIEAVTYFSDAKVCFEAMLAAKWPDGKGSSLLFPDSAFPFRGSQQDFARPSAD